MNLDLDTTSITNTNRRVRASQWELDSRRNRNILQDLESTPASKTGLLTTLTQEHLQLSPPKKVPERPNTPLAKCISLEDLERNRRRNEE